MIMSVSILMIGSGAATPVRLVNFSISAVPRKARAVNAQSAAGNQVQRPARPQTGGLGAGTLNPGASNLFLFP
jgi:hypothetical protein